MLHFMREASKIGTTRKDDTSVLSNLGAKNDLQDDQHGQISHPPIPLHQDAPFHRRSHSGGSLTTLTKGS